MHGFLKRSGLDETERLIPEGGVPKIAFALGTRSYKGPSTSLHQRPNRDAIQPLMRLVDEPKFGVISA